MKSSAISGRTSFRWPAPGEILILNWDIIPPYDVPLEVAPDGVLVVADEAHRSKNSESLRTRGLRELFAAAFAVGGCGWELTGTPVMKDLVDLWTQLVNLGLHHEAFGGNFELFVRLGGGYVDDTGFRPVTEWDPERVDPEFILRLQRVLLCRLKEDVLKELPPKTYEDLVVPMDLPTMKACDEAVAALAARGVTLEKLHEIVHSKKGEVGELSRARAALASCKLHALLPIVEEHEKLGKPLVVMSAHRGPIDVLSERQGWTMIAGGITKKQRDTRSLHFQEGKYLGVACTIQAAGEGLDLFRADTVCFVDEAFVPGMNHQAADRIHRIGQTAAIVRVLRLVADHPLDHRLHEVLWEREQVVTKTIRATAVKEGDVTARLRRLSEAVGKVPAQATEGQRGAK